MAKTLAVVIRDKEQQYEGLRSSLGALLEMAEVKMFVLNHEIEMHEAYQENMEFLDEMEGERFSNVQANVDKHGFQYASLEDIGKQLREADLVVPF